MGAEVRVGHRAIIGKESLVQALATSDHPQAMRLAAPVTAAFKARLADAANHRPSLGCTYIPAWHFNIIATSSKTAFQCHRLPRSWVTITPAASGTRMRTH